MDKRRIDFTAVGQEITFSVTDPIPRGDTQQYLTAHFSVDAAWDGLSLQAVFQRKGRGFSPVTVPLDAGMHCDFPPCLLIAPEGGGTVYIRVGLIGRDSAGKRLTTGFAAVPIAPSCYVRGETPKDPPQDVYSALLKELGTKLEANQGAENAGKVLSIDRDGAVVPVETPTWGGVMTETDPTVPAWAKRPQKPSYTADEVGAVSQDELQAAVNNALAEAKESGEFDGAKGDKGDSYSLSASDKGDIAALVIESLGGQPIFGYVDENNIIELNGNLADGEYTVKYEMENGTVINIGKLVLDTNVYYTITNTLTNCTISNSAKTVAEGESYTATITAKDGYELKSLTVTMGGQAVSVSGGNISIASVTGNIVIVAVAEEVAKEPTDFLEYNATNTSDWSIWINNARIGSDGAYRSSTGQNVTNYIPVQNGDIVHWHDMPLNAQMACLYKSDKTTISAANIPTLVSQGYIKDATTIGATTYDGQLTINNANAAYIRFTILRDGYTSVFDNDDGAVNVERNGEYL